MSQSSSMENIHIRVDIAITIMFWTPQHIRKQAKTLKEATLTQELDSPFISEARLHGKLLKKVAIRFDCDIDHTAVRHRKPIIPGAD